MTASILPNGTLFALETRALKSRIMINQILGSPVGAGIGRICVRTGGPQPSIASVNLPGRGVRFGTDEDRVVWERELHGAGCRATLWFAPGSGMWLWRVEVANRQNSDLECDAILIQDLGLGERGFLMNNEAYASQYIDHHVETSERCGPVIMSRQNLAQSGVHPWILHGCLEGTAAFATDAIQIFGPQFRGGDSIGFPFGQDLPSKLMQHEAACIGLQSRVARLKPGSSALWTFFAAFSPDHPHASSRDDLVQIELAHEAAARFETRGIALAPSVASLIDESPSLAVEALDGAALADAYRERRNEETSAGSPLSFFVPDGHLNRHVVVGGKERIVSRRHGSLLRSGRSMLPDEALLCATAWMHGVFGAQLTLGNTSLHKLFSVSRDPYNILRANGLRILADLGEGWRLLSEPSVFEMGLSDCRWEYRAGGRRITICAIASGEDPAMLWEVQVSGDPCRFLVYGHLVLGEREYEHAGRVAIDAAGKRFSFFPDPQSLWAQHYPDTRYYMITDMPDAVEALGGDEMLFAGATSRLGCHAVLRTNPVTKFRFAVTGSLTDPTQAQRLVEKYERGVSCATMVASGAAFWRRITRRARIRGQGPDATAFDSVLPWLVQNAMIHLTAPHGLEQYTGAAWGTRDVCQGPIEFLLAFEHDETVKDILRIVFAEQYENRGDWPQWFMLEPYSRIRDAHAHGDVIIWPLKALCDYVEATGDTAFLEERVAWRKEDTFAATKHKDTLAAHAEKLIAAARAQFIPGTSLLRYGEGDWNDSLQPADPNMREWMVSSWTVALFFQQLWRYAGVLVRAGHSQQGEELRVLAMAMREDFNRHLIRDGTVAGYAIFGPSGCEPELLLHPRDARTGLKYSLLPMTRSIIGGMFSAEQTRHHLALIRAHLLCPDGVRLMDRPAPYRGGPELVFRRAESSAFVGREIGLMYVHAHLRYAEALAVLSDAEGLWEALLAVNPVTVSDRVANASPRQRNAYFSSSDAQFADRYQASREWDRVKRGDIAVDGGWRVYSSGPGLFLNMLVCGAFGERRHFGARIRTPLLPAACDARLDWT